MDKLKEVLKYKFWILLGVALVLPLVGWGVARSGLIAETASRRDALEKLQGRLKVTPEDPNAAWEARVKDINTKQQAEKMQAWKTLYDAQKKLMTWPEGVNPDELALKGETSLAARLNYANKYAEEWEAVYQIVKPVNEYGEGKVRFDRVAMPSSNTWGEYAPTTDVAQGAQEDLWLLRAILEAVASVNENATSQVDAPIRVVYQVYLRGGSAGGEAPAGGMDAMGMDMMEMGMGMEGGMDMGMSMAGMAMGGAAGVTAGQFGGGFNDQVTFNPTDEFGREVPAPPAEGADPAAAPAMDPSMMDMGLGGDMGAMAAMGPVKMDRYIEKTKPEWKTRGFYLEVVMDHRRVPDLLVALTNSGANGSWPIRITRVHQADFKDEDLFVEGASTTGPGAGAAGLRGGFDPDMGLMGGMPGMGGNRGFQKFSATGGGAGSGFAGPSMGMGFGAMGGAALGRTAVSAGGAGAGMMQPDGMMSPQGGQALDDPMLANVAIDGWLVIMKPPVDPAAADQGAISPDQMPEQSPGAGQQAGDAQQAVGEAAPAVEAAPAAEATETPLPTDEAPAAERDAIDKTEKDNE